MEGCGEREKFELEKKKRERENSGGCRFDSNFDSFLHFLGDSNYNILH